MIVLSKSQVLLVHKMMIEKTGGLDGVRDESLLDSALNVPFQTFDGKDIYPALLPKAAVLCRSLVSNHPFADGNKRTGVHTMLIFLEINGVELNYMQNDLVELGLGVASGKMAYDDILIWLTEHNK